VDGIQDGIDSRGGVWYTPQYYQQVIGRPMNPSLKRSINKINGRYSKVLSKLAMTHISKRIMRDLRISPYKRKPNKILLEPIVTKEEAIVMGVVAIVLFLWVIQSP